MTIIINPGTGPIEGSSRQLAERNIQQFVVDLGIPCTITEISEQHGNGRFAYRLDYDGKSHVVEMPGLEQEHVRYMGEKYQNIWNFPRLYVDGSSWIWCYALSMCFDEDEDF